MSQALAMPRRLRVSPKTIPSRATERMLRDIAFVLQASGRLADEIRRGRAGAKPIAAACALAS
jgi:hypothetical protein